MTLTTSIFRRSISSCLLGLTCLFIAIGCGEEPDQRHTVFASTDGVETTRLGLSSMWGQHSTKQKRRNKLHSSEGPTDLLPISHFDGDTEDSEMEFVRETGFRPYLEDETDRELVRETGFMPTPRLTLVSVENGIADLSWTIAPNVAYYLLVGRVIEDGVLEQHGTSFILITTEASIDLDDDVWQFSVTAIGNDKARRSKASNRVQANPNAE
jgi:hypothetical protein